MLADPLATLTLIEPPPAEPITVAELKAQLRVDISEDDTLLSSLIVAARQHIEGRDGWLNRALAAQTWELAFTAFPCGAIRLPMPPLQEVVSVTYLDTGGVLQTLSTVDYQVVKAEPALIVPAYGKTWPAARCQVEAIRVRFTCGYEPGGGSPEDYAENIPKAIKQALLLLAAHWYENRTPVVIGSMPAALPFSVSSLLAPYKTGWV